MTDRHKNSTQQTIQLVWGVALVLMGLAFFFRIPEIMRKVADIEYFSAVQFILRIGFYIMAGILIGGGLKKLYRFWRPTEQDRP